ncbi:AraC-like DNA-binding protein [Algoriphagus sp. 4150]|uniref:helix-turn-helix domain-containing protein n=1 Tax=Algoriphagus sp. 4150 TaxID=2817756 RepID=UPI00286313D9|nr:helix-turn-helix domain-containing protein [Algoriphagus sp. 4150]MDR7132022.1 AraC-like DNA-binding protein [Algoriphagus sp. 4150]
MSILYLLSSLGVINGLLIGVFLVFRSQNKISNGYLGGLLLALSLRIGKSVFYYFEDNVDLLILQIGLSACTFIGPFFYLYTKATYHHYRKINTKDVILLSILFLSVLTVGLVYPYRTSPAIWNGYIVYAIYTVWAVFTLPGLYYVAKILGSALLKPSTMSRLQQHLAILTIAMLFINLTYQMALYGLFTYLWGALIFSFTLYLMLGRMLLSGKFFTSKSADQPIKDAYIKLDELNLLMHTQKPYVNQKLKLDDLATMAGLSKHSLSKLLNEEYKHGFAHYVKEFRVLEAKQLIQTRNELSLEGIGFEAGFSSKSSFFDAFKKITNSTPSEYRKTQQMLV